MEHERMGDAAVEHHLYADAAQHYQDAINVRVHTPDEHSRVLEKLAYALSLGGSPNTADPYFEQVLASYLQSPANAEKTIEILLQRARQLWLNAKTEAALPLVAQAVQVANNAKSTKMCALTTTRMANYLIGINRHKDADVLLRPLGQTIPDDDVAIASTFYTQKAIIAAAFGNKAAAAQFFNDAITTAKEDSDPYQSISVWRTQGIWMLELGETQLARSSTERALLLARQYHIPWQIQAACLGYADTLYLLGEYEKAYMYLLNALSYEVEAPVLESLRATMGILTALYMRDESALEQCTRPAAFEAFEKILESRSSASIAAEATVFAHWHYAKGRKKEARSLLHRSVVAIGKGDHFGFDVWGYLPITIAQLGAAEDLPEARRFINARLEVPCNGVAIAVLCLFNALVAKRNGRLSQAVYEAKEAVERFRLLGWYSFVDVANTLLPKELWCVRETSVKQLVFGDSVNVLTTRERSVAELVLKGLTNPEIAAALSISKHTVHSHITSILNRLGLRSRYQLEQVLFSPDK